MNSWKFAFPADAVLLTWMCFFQFHHFPQLIPRQYEGRHRFPRIERTRWSGPSNRNVSLDNGVHFTQITEGSFCSGLCHRLRSIMFCGVNLLTCFFGDLILDLLQAAWAPSSCYLSSVSCKLMGCNCMNCLSHNPGMASEQPGQEWECLAR